MEKVKSVLKWLDKNFETMFMAPMLGILTLLMVYDITMREVFSMGEAWPQELARYIMLYITYLGVGFGVRFNGHIRVDIIPQVVPKTRRVFDIIADILMIIFAIFLLWGGIPKLASLEKSGQVSTALKIPMKYVYMGLEIGWVIALLRLIQKTANRIFFGIKDGFNEHRSTIMD